MDCQPLEGLYELFLLGTLSEEESVELREHLQQRCAPCLERIREATQTVYLLSLMTKPVRPDPKLKSQILRRLHKK
jgi:hypothetical protein